MEFSFSPAAQNELDDALAYYAAHANMAVMQAFWSDINHVLDLLGRHPAIGRSIGENFRAFGLRKFPYSVIYKQCNETIEIFAIAHQRRKPAYWQSRV